MIFVLFILLLGVMLFVSAIIAVGIRSKVLKECEAILEHYESGLMAGQEARKKLTELKKKMIVKQHKDEVQDFINLIRD